MITDLVSKRVRELESYKAEPVLSGLALDKNEIPWSLEEKVQEALLDRLKSMEFNRYPDSNCTALKEAISRYTGVGTASICVGNGSDELIGLLLQAFIEPGDVMAVYNPSFSMYKICGSLCGAKIWENNPDWDFRLKPDEFVSGMQKEKPKVVFLCNPNNPTGGSLELEELEQMLDSAPGIVVVDEAYYEFSGITATSLLPEYENLIILRTFSKALGLAGLRIGYMLASPEIISYIDRIRSPFNVNAFAQLAAEVVLENMPLVTERVKIIKDERERLRKLLAGLKEVKCFDSGSNFLLLQIPNAAEVYERLKDAGIYTKSFNRPPLRDCIRVTVGSRQENDRFYKALKEALYESP